MDFNGIILTENVKSPRLYKLTNSLYECRQGFKWSNNSTYECTGEDLLFPKKYMSMGEFSDACAKKIVRSPTWNKWILAYTNPIIAILLNPIHDDIKYAIIWECDGKASYYSVDNRAFCKKLTTRRIINCADVGLFSRLKFAFACVSRIYKDDKFENWMIDWNNAKRRSSEEIHKISSHCSHQGTDEAKIASTLCWACAVWSDNKFIPQNNRLVEYWTAKAASESNYFAKVHGIDFDLVSIAEITFAAK